MQMETKQEKDVVFPLRIMTHKDQQNFAKVTTRQKPLAFTCCSIHIFSSSNILSYVDLA